MFSLNPFKKKEKDFGLDNEIPSLKDLGSSSGPLDNQSMPFSQQEPSNPMPPNSNNMNSFNQNLTNNNPIPPQNDFQSFPPPQQPQQQPFPQQNQQQFEQQNNQNDIYKAKIESLESKVDLLNNKLNTQEEMLKQIYNILIEEVSEDTKSRLQLNKMVEHAREKNNRNF